ncbi:MAG: hypothetical protein HOC70_07105 [Gammaproteobacteria bacterium]|nr:hypothetical protein [Gammaproteobacteria bacterium]
MFFVFLFALFFSADLLAYESDQYRNRTQYVADSLEVMDLEVNDALRRIIKQKRQPGSRHAFSRAIWKEVGGWYWADKIERWAARSPTGDKYDQTRHKSIYRSMPIWATRVNFIFGVGRSFRLNDEMVGSDKFGHFFSQGFKYYKRELRGESRERLLAKGAFAERWIFGQLTTGVYSNADLVANYEGWRFYQSLFQDDVIPGKKSILKRTEGRYVLQRPFTWADHINAYWDEALNPSFNVKSLNWRLRQSILKLCSEVKEAPEFYLVPDDGELWARYADIGLKDNRSNQFVAICGLN